MKMYQQAQLELYGRLVEIYDHGFICHNPVTNDGGIYIQLCYIEKEFRSKGYARQYLQELCNKYSALYLTGFIDLNTNNYKDTLIKHLNAGYNIIDGNKDSLIVSITKENLFKEIK